MTTLADATGIPAIPQWRASDGVPIDSPVFAGALGYGRTAGPPRIFDEADLVLAVGAVPSEIRPTGTPCAS